ncbi:mammalian cell entry protein [Mycobacterium kyorinense]|uniref:Mammalian cell entry protein n=1 Tax=Mycobacterium kyorinense TaxID=487514 RepID=A0A1A2ZWF4_9MYCO|nr:mammalian cell entry protein [Mycobacterium kyorinense]
MGGLDARSEAVVTDAEPTEPTKRRTRRRASRAAGPTGGETATATTVRVETPAEPTKRRAAPVGPPPRRPAHRRLVGMVALAAGLVGIAALTAGVAALFFQHRDAEAQRLRDQRFVDTATQTVVNMFSYTQETIDESVTRAVDGTSGPLRGMLSSNAENIKTLYRHTDATSEVVVNGAALEGFDDVTDNASVLVSVRVTVTDLDGVNKPSMPYRMRVIVHQDDTGRMTGYDLKYPEGGN